MTLLDWAVLAFVTFTALYCTYRYLKEKMEIPKYRQESRRHPMDSVESPEMAETRV